MLNSLPLELVTMIGSGLLSGLMTIWSQSLKSKQEAHNRAIEALSAQREATADARNYENKGFQFTRRILALSAIASIVVWPKIVPVFFPEIDVTVGYTAWKPGWLFFDGHEKIKWVSLKGLVLTPLDTHLMSGIIGLYFGASIAKNAR